MARIRAQQGPDVETLTGPETQVTGIQDPGGSPSVPGPIGDVTVPGGSLAVPSVASPPKQAVPGDSALAAAVARERIKAAEKKIADRTARMKAKDPWFDPGEDSRIARWQGAIARQKAKSAIASPSLRENKKITNSSLKKLIRNILRTDYE
jgi:hypothetical protein